MRTDTGKQIHYYREVLHVPMEAPVVRILSASSYLFCEVSQQIITNLSLCSPSLSTTPWRRIEGLEVQFHPFFDLGTRRRWVVSFTPRKS